MNPHRNELKSEGFFENIEPLTIDSTHPLVRGRTSFQENDDRDRGSEIKPKLNLGLFDAVKAAVEAAVEDTDITRIEEGEESDYEVTKITLQDGLIVATVIPKDCICGQHQQVIIINPEGVDDDTAADHAAAYDTLAEIVLSEYEESIENDDAEVLFLTV